MMYRKCRQYPDRRAQTSCYQVLIYMLVNEKYSKRDNKIERTNSNKNKLSNQAKHTWNNGNLISDG